MHRMTRELVAYRKVGNPRRHSARRVDRALRVLRHEWQAIEVELPVLGSHLHKQQALERWS